MDQLHLQLLAQAGAYRELLVNFYAHRLLDEPDPIGAARALKNMFRSSPTAPPREGSHLDPATSDLLAAMTDDAIQEVLDRVIEKLERFLVPN